MSFQNWHEEFYEFWPVDSKISKICNLMGCFWPKYIMLELKNYRGVIFHDTEEWCKVWRKTDLWFGKWREEFDKFLPDHSTVSKLGLWWGPFIQSRKCMSLKFTSYVSWQWRMMQNLKRNWLVSSKWTWGIQGNLTWALKNLKNFHFNGLLLTKVCNVWAWNVQRSYVWWHWRLMQNSKETDLCFQQRHEKSDKFSPEHLKVSILGLWWDPFIQTRKCMSLKFTGELCVMTMENNAKFEEELICQFKIEMRK